MYGRLEIPSGLTLMGADTPPGMGHTPGSTFSVRLSGGDDTELRGGSASACRSPVFEERPSTGLTSMDVTCDCCCYLVNWNP